MVVRLVIQANIVPIKAAVSETVKARECSPKPEPFEF